MGFPISGAYPGVAVGVELAQKHVIWTGPVTVNGGGQSNVEWLVLNSNPALATSGYPSKYMPQMQRVRVAHAFGTFGFSGQLVTVTIASGGVPDTISGGKAAVSGILGIGGLASGLGGAPGGVVVGVQWAVAPMGSNGVATPYSPATSGLVSGQTIGLLLIGD